MYRMLLWGLLGVLCFATMACTPRSTEDTTREKVSKRSRVMPATPD